MRLTTAQIATLKADIAAQPSLVTAVQTHDFASIASFYNSPGSATVWRSDIAPGEIASAVTMTDFVALTAVKQNGLLLLTQGSAVDASNANVRAAFQAIFGASTTLTALTAIAQRIGTRLELLFSTPASPSNVSSLYGTVLDKEDAQIAVAS